MATAKHQDPPAHNVVGEPTPGPQALAATWPQPCGTCKFYGPVGSLCRYNPPSAIYGSNQTTPAGASVSSPVSFWPMVDAVNDWCGQYIAKG